MSNRQSKQPGDIVALNGRTWRILGCYIGALGQEDVIGLEALDRRPPCAGEGKIYEMLVPEALVEGHVFRALSTSEEAGA